MTDIHNVVHLQALAIGQCLHKSAMTGLDKNWQCVVEIGQSQCL